jgi:uncharacterized Zn finger protein
MKLSDMVENDIWKIADSGSIVARGLDYYESGMISSMTVSEDGIKAKVRGTYGEYDVNIRVENGEIVSDCDCPYSGYGCKHKVAVLFKFIKERGGEELPAAENPEIDIRFEISKMSKEQMISILSDLCEVNEDVKRDVFLSMRENDVAIKAGRDILVDQILDVLYGSGEFISYEDVFHMVTLLEDIKKRVLKLAPEDRSEILRTMIDGCYDAFYRCDDSSGSLGEVTMECLEDLGRSIRDQELTKDEKRGIYRDILPKIFDEKWGMEEGYVNMILNIPSAPGDFTILLEELSSKVTEKTHHEDIFKEIMKKAYLGAGRDEEYLSILEEEEDITELVRYWDNKGERGKAVKIAEEGLKTSTSILERFDIINYLKETYSSLGKWEDLNRIQILEFGGHSSLKTYKQIKEVAEKIGNWGDIRKGLLEMARGDEHVRILLFDGEKEEASIIAKRGEERLSEEVRKEVASMIEKDDPRGAVRIYDQLMNDHIDNKNRADYRLAALFAKRVKKVLLNVDEEEEWERFLSQVREQNRNRPALLQEFRRL